jgi:hypothetical protein
MVVFPAASTPSSLGGAGSACPSPANAVRGGAGSSRALR